MAKASGLGQTTLSVDDSAASAQAIKNDITNWQLSTPRGVQDITGVDKSANERLLLLADCSVTLNGVFNAASRSARCRLNRSDNSWSSSSIGIQPSPNLIPLDD